MNITFIVTLLTIFERVPLVRSTPREGAQNEIRQSVVEADARQLSNTLNRDLIRFFIDFNFSS
ncbi:phage portal protein family protein [Veronia pacifica]|uniref:phage portal protein family protein n=1 Tax=Veronia pacifica TaxID=1080227 RepID=UPI001112E03F